MSFLGRIATVSSVVLVVTTSARATLVNVNTTGDIIPTTATVNATSTIFATHQAVDDLTLAAVLNEDNGQLFNGADAQIMAVTGFNSALGEVRVHTILEDAQRVPVSVTVRSSTTSKSTLVAGDYETALGTFTLGPAAFSTPTPVQAGQAAAGSEYASLLVNAPAGTQSLFLDFDSDGQFGFSGTRIAEIQAYVPEPASAGLLALAGLAMMRRKR